MNYGGLYSSKTGNTQKVAQAVCAALPEAPADFTLYDCVFAAETLKRLERMT